MRIDENETPFGFVGYQGARKNVAIDGADNIITCAPFSNRIFVGPNEHPANFETVIVKRNANGQVIWSRTLQGGGFKYGHSIKADSIGNIYLLGWYYGNSTIEGQPIFNYGNYDCFLIKFNQQGVIQYTKTLGSSGYDYPMDLEVDAVGNVYVLGKFNFSLQSGTMSITGGSDSHFLLKFNPFGTQVYLKNICQSGGGDWGRGALSLSSRGHLTVVSNFSGTGNFQGKFLSGGGGYMATINPLTGDVESVYKAGAEAWLVDHEPSGNAIILGMQRSNTDSIGDKRLPNLTQTNQLYIARVLVNESVELVEALPKTSGSYGALEGFRSIHISRAGQIYLAGDLESAVLFPMGTQIDLNLPHDNGRPQAVLAKLDEFFECRWFAGAGSRDTLGVPNRNFGTGVFSDPVGNVVWGTMNDAYSVDSTVMIMNNDVFISGVQRSRYKAHGIHFWKFSEPSILTLTPTQKAYCVGDTIAIQYQRFGDFNPTNRYQLQMSDSAGSFVNPVILAETPDSNLTELKGVIPYESIPNDRYRFRVSAVTPDVRGSVTQLITIRDKPLANAGTDAFFCLGDTVRLVASGAGGLTWQTKSDVIAVYDSVLFAYPDSHSFYVLRVDDLLSPCVNYDTIQLRYRDTVKIGGLENRNACLGETIQLNPVVLRGDNDRMAFHWHDSTGFLISTNRNFQAQILSPQKYMLSAWDSCSLFGDTVFIQVGVRDPLQLILVDDTLACRNALMSLAPKATGGDSMAYRFLWYDSTYSVFIKETSSLDSAYNTSTKLGVIVLDGCSDAPDSLIVSVNVALSPNILSDTVRICFGDTALVRVEVQNGYPGSWLYNWDNTGFDTTSVLKEVITTSRNVPIIVRDECGQTASGAVPVKVRQPVTLNIRSDSTLCQGESIQIFVAGTELDPGHYDFFWNAEGVSRNYFTELPLISQTYKVRMVNVCDGAQYFDSVQVVVRDPLKLTLPAQSSYCYGQTVDFQPTLSGGLSSSYQLSWKDDQGVVFSNALTWQATIRDSLKFSLVLEDGCTVVSDSLSFSLITTPPLEIQQQADTNLCFNQSLVFIPSYGGGVGSNYRYTITPLDSAAFYNGAGLTDNTMITVWLSDGCSETVGMSFTAMVGAPLQVTLPNDTMICEGSSLVFDPVISGGIPADYVYAWQGMNSPIKRLTLAEVNTDESFVFCLNDGCSEEKCDSVVVKVQSLPLADFSMNDTLLCVPGEAGFSAANVSPSMQYHWFSSELQLDSVVQGNATLFVPVSRAGRFNMTLELVDSNGCIGNSGEMPFTAIRKPSADFTLSNSEILDRGEELELILKEKDLAQSIWEPAEVYELSQGLFGFVYQDTGNILFRHIAINSAGCSDTAYDTLRVKEPFSCYVPSAFNPLGLEINKVFYPVCQEYSEYDLRIYNRWGQLVFESDGNKPYWDGTWFNEGEELPMGLYVYVLNLRNQYAEVYRTQGSVMLIR